MNERSVMPLVGLAVGALAFGLLAWMTDSPEPAPDPPPAASPPPPATLDFERVHPPLNAPEPTGEVVWAVQTLPDGLHPLDPQSPEELAASSLVYDWVFYRSAQRGQDKGGAWRSRVVTDWSQEQDQDGQEWVELTLRDDLRWHDGQPLTAGDLCFTAIERAVRTDLHGPRRCVVVDDHTARLGLPEIDGEVQAMLAFPILPRHQRDVLKGTDEPNETHTRPVGSGPYTAMVGRRSIRFTVADVPHHAPLVQQITWQQASDPLVAARTLIQGGYDAVFGLPVLYEGEILEAGGSFSDGGSLGRIAWADPSSALRPGPDAPLADLDGS